MNFMLFSTSHYRITFWNTMVSQFCSADIWSVSNDSDLWIRKSSDFSAMTFTFRCFVLWKFLRVQASCTFGQYVAESRILKVSIVVLPGEPLFQMCCAWNCFRHKLCAPLLFLFLRRSLKIVCCKFRNDPSAENMVWSVLRETMWGTLEPFFLSFLVFVSSGAEIFFVFSLALLFFFFLRCGRFFPCWGKGIFCSLLEIF